MPNWCYTQVQFRGNLEDIQRLEKDIESAVDWLVQNNYKFLNLSYFFSLNEFNVEEYCNRYRNSFFRPNFRGSINDSYRRPLVYVNSKNLYVLDTTFETAWGFDHDVLRLISMIYHVEYSAYSEEPNMEYYAKSRNGDVDTYDYDIAITPNYNQIDEKDSDIQDEIYNNDFAGKSDGDEIRHTINTLNKYNIEYDTYSIFEDEESRIYGVYYSPIPGVYYE